MSIFSKVKINKPKRSTFDLSHDNKLTSDIGRLTPIGVYPVLPGDKFNVNSEVYIRLAPMLAPVMHRVNVYVHHFFIPIRLLWEDWETFITGGKTGTEEKEYPRIITTVGELKLMRSCIPSSLWDYIGLPCVKDDNSDPSVDDTPITFDPLPFLAYYKIWQYYYADQNLTTFAIDEDWKFPSGIFEPENVGSDSPGKYVAEILQLRNRAWEKDYFTSALPDPQRGQDVRLPIQGAAPVDFSTANGWKLQGLRTNPADADVKKQNGNLYIDSGSQGSEANLIPKSQVFADLSQATQSSINELRRGFALQRFFEQSARVGWRYFEYLLGIWGVKNPDGRLQRPEYLGGGKQPVVIGEVLQTSETSSNSPLGDMAGRGVSAGSRNGFTRYFTEYGYVITLMSVIPRSSYSQGWPRLFNKFDRFDFGNPYFAHLGEQEVKKGELYFDFKRNTLDSDTAVNSGVNAETFGYQSRFSEYKYIPGSYHGDFRNNLDFWHLGRKFSNMPGLNEDFVTVHENDAARIWNVQTANGDPIDHLWIQVYNNIKASRCLPYYGTPSL